MASNTGDNKGGFPAPSPARPGLRLMLSLTIPMAAFWLQWFFWEAISPFVWFFFYPAVFFSSWIGGIRGGLASTAISTAVVWWFFIPVRYSFVLDRPTTGLSIGLFAVIGVLFSVTHERLKKASQLAAEALAKELEAFSYSVSHDLRAPLRAVDGYTWMWALSLSRSRLASRI